MTISDIFGGRGVSFEANPGRLLLRPPPEAGGWDQGPPRSSGWEPLRAKPRLVDAGDGILAAQVEARGAGAIGARIERRPNERFWGFGIRSDAVERIGGVVENWVGEGPYQLEEYRLVEAITPGWAIRRRRDAAYYPVPWLLSSAGFGVLVEGTAPSRFRLSDEAPGEWAIEVFGDRLRLRVFAGPAPADVLRRFTAATGHQPFPAARWFLGPWVQTGHADLVPYAREKAILDRLRAADAPISAVETHMRRLPGGAHEGRRGDEVKRTRLFRERGLKSLTYLNPFVSVEYGARFQRAEPLLQRRPDGGPYTYPAYVGGRTPPLTTEGQLDFSASGAEEFFAELAAEAVEDGHDGWMEDFGEYTPPDAVLADGTPGEEAHNRYPVDYHAAGARAAEAVGAGRPIARFARSGWTGAAPHLPLVWGGDPTTGWGFDGLESALVQALNAGLSGVAFFGTDIGGFFTLGEQRLDRELLIRWIQLGALLPLMRTKAQGIGLSKHRRPQVWDADVLPHWRRWAKLHTQLSSYLLGAAAEYVESGLPIVRHHCLATPDDPAARRADQYLLGEWLLAAPVLQPRQRTRDVRLPPGQWVDLWRSLRYEESSGGLRLEAASLLGGPGTVTLPAPLAEAPLLARLGACLPLLPAEVASLAAPLPAGRLDVIAFPAGRTVTRFDRDGRLVSDLGHHGWKLLVDSSEGVDVSLQASLSFSPKRLRVSGGQLDAWSYDGGTAVLHAVFSGHRPTLEAIP